MISLDRDGCFTSLNPKAEQVFARSAQSLIGQPLTSVLDPFSHEKAALMLDRTMNEGAVTEWELDHLQPNGPPVLLGYTTSVLHDEQGVVVGIGAIGNDLTSKLNLTEKLAYTNQELEGTLLKLEKTLDELKSTQAQLVQSEKMRSLGQLVAGIAHEINNPAAFVANNLDYFEQILPGLRNLFDAYQLLKANGDDELLEKVKQAEKDADLEYLWSDLEAIVKESQDGIKRIRNIVISLRTFSHLDEAELKRVDIRNGLASTLNIIRPSCKNRIELLEKYETVPEISCHPGELNQVFLNLLTNAVQAIEETGTIEIDVRQIDNNIQIRIKDDGRGMDEKTLAHLGEPFFTTKDVGQGTGLGLSISYGIIEKHHGKLKFDSSPGEGTTVTVLLPVDESRD